MIRPGIDRGNQWFWDGAANHELLLQKCSSCGRVRVPPAPMCGTCQSLDWEVQPASGRGTIHSWVLSHHPTEPDAAPRIVALVELDEGVRIVSNVIDADPVDVDNELPVELTFVTYEDVTLPQFRLVGAPT